jgi:hypothetical protein
MAERRMFTKKIIDSDAFLEMPCSAQALYFHLAMRADDDGFVNGPKKIKGMCGASDDDLKLLLMKRFILAFESGIIVIKHWRMHNLLRKDRYTPTQYIEEKDSLLLKADGAYTEKALGNQMATKWHPLGNQMATQYSIGKESIDKYSLGECSGSIEYTAATTATTENVENSVENCTDEKLEPLGGIGMGVVFLTKSQMDDLIERLGIDTFDLYIGRLADFIIDKKAKVKSCYDTILKWVAEDSRTN